MDGERGVLWTAHIAVLVALAQAVCAWCVAELARLREQLGGVLAVGKDDVVDAALVEEDELVERVGELGGGVLPGALQPLDALVLFERPSSPLSSGTPRWYMAPGCRAAAAWRKN